MSNERIEELLNARAEHAGAIQNDNDAAWWHEENPEDAAELARLLAEDNTDLEGERHDP